MPKRKYSRSYRRARKKARVGPAAAGPFRSINKAGLVNKKRNKLLRSTIKKQILSMAETKHTHIEFASNQELLHNQWTRIEPDILKYITNGNRTFERIGDKIFLKGIAFRILLEGQQYRPITTYKIIMIRNRREDDEMVTGTNIFEGTTTTKCLDFIDTNKYEVKFIKTVVVRMPNSGTSNPMGGTVHGAANKVLGGEDYEVFGNPQKLLKFYVPFNKTITYRDNAATASDYSWNLGVIAYCNFSTTTNTTTYPVGHISCVAKMYWKDP